MTGDFTGDGRTDLAVANSGRQHVSILLGNGNGTFQTRSLTRWGPYRAIVAGDFTGDGRPTSPSPTRSTPTRVDPAGQRRRHLPEPGHLPVGSDQTPSWRGTSPATAAPTWPSPTTATNDGVDAAGQRRRHLPAPGHLRGGFRLQAPSWRGTSTATAAPTSPSPTTTTTTCRCSWATATAPSRPQVTYAVGSDPTPRGGGLHRRRPPRPRRRQRPTATRQHVSVLLGNGDGTFQAPETYAVGSNPSAIVAGDFTGDGRTDLAVANSGYNDRVGAAGQRRRHLPDPGHLRGGVRPRSPS